MSDPIDEQPHERRGYEGHHPVHAGLQKHSVGEAYPLALVGYGNGDRTDYRLENLMTGQTLCCCSVNGKTRKAAQWSQGAVDYADRLFHELHRAQHLQGPEVFASLELDATYVWEFVDRKGDPISVPLGSTKAAAPIYDAAKAASYKPMHGGYADVPPRAFNNPGSGPLETR